MKKTWTAAALAICAMAWCAPGMAQHGNADPPKCNLRTLSGSYVLAASGFVIVAGVPQPKALIEQIDFNGDGSAVSPNAALALNGNALAFSSGGAASYEFDGDSCSGKISFANGPTHKVYMDPDGDKGWTLVWMPVGNVFQGTLTRVWPPKGRDERH